MSDIILEIVRSLILLGIIVYLVRTGHSRSELSRKGWRFIIVGFFLLFFGSTIDITDNFEYLNKFIVIGDTPAQAFLEKMVGFLGGFLILAIGLIRWIPTVTTIEELKKFRIATEGISEHIMFTDPDGKILYVNAASEKITGYSKDEMLGRRPSLWGNKMSKEFYKKMWKIIKEDKKNFFGEIKNKRKNGEEYIAELRISPILDEKKNIKFFVGIERDITDRIKAEEEIRKVAKFPSENPNPVVRVSNDNTVLYANNVASLLLRSVGSSAGEEMPKLWQQAVEESFRSKQSKKFDFEYNEIIFSFVVVPILDAGYANLYGRDVTKERKIDKMKSDFVSLVSHQLKTPTAEIMGYASNMLSGLTGDITKEQKQYLVDMKDIASRNYKLISNLLNVSQLERGIIEVNTQRVSINEIVNFTVQEYAENLKEKGIAMRTENMDKEITVSADRDKLIEAIRNVVENAIKFTDKGTITIKLKSDSDYGIIEVRDTGRGMTDDVLANLFQKERILSGPPAPKHGAGLGLYIAKKFMELQHGEIVATSMLGKGSTFTFKIPLMGV